MFSLDWSLPTTGATTGREGVGYTIGGFTTLGGGGALHEFGVVQQPTQLPLPSAEHEPAPVQDPCPRPELAPRHELGPVHEAVPPPDPLPEHEF